MTMDADRTRTEAGAVAVEMAIVTPLLILLLFGIIVFGWVFFRLQSMESAVREAGRLAAVGADIDTIVAKVRDIQIVTGDDGEPVVTVKLDGTAMTTGVPCQDKRDSEVEITAALSTTAADDAGLTIPLFGDVAPTYEATSSFRCEK